MPYMISFLIVIVLNKKLDDTVQNFIFDLFYSQEFLFAVRPKHYHESVL